MSRQRSQPLTGWSDAWLLAVIGLVFCALGLGLALLYWHNEETFQDRAVPARAVIDQLYATAPFHLTSPGGGYYYDQYGIVHFPARGRTAHAHVLLVADCSGDCLPVYRPGQAITIYYSPQNPTYAELNRPDPAHSGGLLLAVFLIPILPLFGLVMLAAAAINLVAAVQDHRSVRASRAPPRTGRGRGKTGPVPFG